MLTVGGMGEKAREADGRTRSPFDLGLCCDQAQADGVPCTELGRLCEVCERVTGTGSVFSDSGEKSRPEPEHPKK